MNNLFNRIQYRLNPSGGPLTPMARLVIIGVPIAIVILLLVIFQTVSRSQFRLVESIPSRTLPTSTNTIVLNFNRELKPTEEQQQNYISFTPDLSSIVTINSKTMLITFVSQPEKDSTFAIELRDLRSTKDESLTTRVEYAVKYIPYGQLSDEERERQSRNVGRPEDRNPLLSKLPHDEISFRISYITNPETFGTASDWRAERDNYTVTVSTFVPEPAAKPDDAYTKSTLQIRQRALDWIRKQGVDPDNDINIAFIPGDIDLQGSGEDEFTGDGAPPESIENADAPSEEEASTILIDNGEGGWQ